MKKQSKMTYLTILFAGMATAAPTHSLSYALEPAAAVYYIRPDGGNTTQCTGLADTAYPGTGNGLACAWDHPFRAFPPDGSPRITGGDTLIIAPKSGGYMMGYGAPQTEGNCSAEGAFGCYMPPIPSGPSANARTRILGSQWDKGCTQKTELWGTQRADIILNLTDSSHVEVSCLEITDHSGCVEGHSGGLACQRDTYPFGSWASRGLYAEDSNDVILRDLDIHGLGSTGVHAGRLSDWLVERVRIAGNGNAGWDGDLWTGQDNNTGTMTFRRWLVEWNGCGETWPGGQPAGCWGQTAGGYGDGVGTGATGGDWIIEDSSFLHNTSDGLDLLYHTMGGSITLNRVRAEGNAGNQIKVAGQTKITNGVFVGNCAFFEGKSFTHHVDACRALGNAVEVVYTGGEQMEITNTSIYGQGDGLVGAGPREGFTCNGKEKLIGRNLIFRGDTDYFDSGDITFLFYQEGCGSLRFDLDYSVAYNVKNTESTFVTPAFPSTHNILADPKLVGPLSGQAYGMQLQSGSPGIDTGSSASCPSVDILGVSRPQDGDGNGVAICDLGGYEFLPGNPSVTTTIPAGGSSTSTSTSTSSIRSTTTTTATVVSTTTTLPGSGGTTLQLNNRRFLVSVDWVNYNDGSRGSGQAVGLTSDSGYFWFFNAANIELIVKVLDGRSVNGSFWVMFGALTDLEYTLRVTDQQTGRVKTYYNPPRTMASRADTGAFPGSSQASSLRR